MARICNDPSMLELMTVPTVQDEKDNIMRKKLIPAMRKSESYGDKFANLPPPE